MSLRDWVVAPGAALRAEAALLSPGLVARRRRAAAAGLGRAALGCPAVTSSAAWEGRAGGALPESAVWGRTLSFLPDHCPPVSFFPNSIVKAEPSPLCDGSGRRAVGVPASAPAACWVCTRPCPQLPSAAFGAGGRERGHTHTLLVAFLMLSCKCRLRVKAQLQFHLQAAYSS